MLPNVIPNLKLLRDIICGGEALFEACCVNGRALVHQAMELFAIGPKFRPPHLHHVITKAHYRLCAFQLYLSVCQQHISVEMAPVK